jgi:hypothetical protein
MSPEEAALWAVSIKAVTDIIASATNRAEVTLEDLDEAVQNEEIRSKILEAKRRDLLAKQ